MIRFSRPHPRGASGGRRSPLLRKSGAARLLPLLLLLPIGPPAVAETISLAEAAARARTHAREVALAQAQRAGAEARADVARSYRLPAIGLTESWLRTDSPADVFGLLLSQERFSFQEFVASDPNQPDPLTSFGTHLTIGVPIYTGGELAARVEQAGLAAGAARDGVRRAEDEASLAAAQAFVQLDQARAYVGLLERALATADAHVGLARAYVEEGLIVASERLRAEVERSRLADLLAEARGRAKVAEAALSLRLAADLDSRWELVPLAPPIPLERDLPDWLAAATGRADLAAARTMARIAELEIDVARAARRPRIGVGARYDLLDDELLGTGGDHATVMAAARLELFAGGRHRAAAEVARAGADEAQIQVDRFSEGIRLEVLAAWQEALTARDRLETTSQALAAAAETERIVEERFRQGVVKILDLLDASTARREAETRELVARADAHLATLRLATAAGQRPETAIPSPAGARP